MTKWKKKEFQKEEEYTQITGLTTKVGEFQQQKKNKNKKKKNNKI